MPESLTFRPVAGGEQVTRDVSYGDDVPAGKYLLGQIVRFDGREFRQHRPVTGPRRRDGYERLDNEILAGRQLHQLADWRYPPQVSKLYGDEANSAEPFALFEPYQGRTVREACHYGDVDFEQFVTDLLTGLCWIAAAGIVHQMISPETVFWLPQRGVLITDFSRSTIFGAPRSELKEYEGWVPPELRSGSCSGTAGPRDDLWAASRLIFYVRNQGDETASYSQIADLEVMFGGMFNRMLGLADNRPTAREVLEDGLGQAVNVPSAAQRSDRLKAGREKFLNVRRRKHPDASTPGDFDADLDWMDGPASPPATPVNGDHPAAAGHTSAEDAAPYPPVDADDDRAGTAPRASGTGLFRRKRGD